jgi:hypothetical protein
MTLKKQLDYLYSEFLFPGGGLEEEKQFTIRKSDNITKNEFSSIVCTIKYVSMNIYELINHRLTARRTDNQRRFSIERWPY